jgi:hypothetical protein
MNVLTVIVRHWPGAGRHWPVRARQPAAGFVLSVEERTGTGPQGSGRTHMATLDKWLIRTAILGGTAAVVAAGLFWLVLTRPVAVASVLDRLF